MSDHPVVPAARRFRRATWLLAGLGAALVAAPSGPVPAAAQEPAPQRVAAVSAPPAIASDRRLLAAYGERVVWSEWSPKGKRFRLMSSDGGRIERLPVRGQAAPFEADVGPDRRGRPVIVYSRCAARAPRDCDIYRFDFATRRERRVRGVSTRAHAEVLPAVWKDRIAFVRIPKRRNEPRIYVRRAGGRSERVPGGTMGNRSSEFPAVLALDLRGDRAAFIWHLEPKGEACGESSGITITAREVWTATARGGARRLRTSCNARESMYHGVSLAAGSVFHDLATIEGSFVRRTCLGTGASDLARLPSPADRNRSAVDFVQDGRRSYYLEAGSDGGDVFSAALPFAACRAGVSRRAG